MSDRMLLPIDGISGYFRDVGSHAVVCADRRALLDAKNRKNEVIERKRRISDLETQVVDLKQRVIELERIVLGNK